jgi:hypothetical protein
MNIDNSFWNEFPDYRITNPFKELYTADKTKNKKDSSMMMWFVRHCYHPSSRYFKLPIDDKHELIGGDYCGDINYYKKNKATIDMLVDAFCKLEMTSLQRHMIVWNTLLDKRTKFLESVESYDLENFEDLDKMAVGSDKVYTTIKKIEADMAKEDSNGSVKGGAKPSLSD